ncbi:hypothetical protein FGE05_00145 [Pseudomonas sp. ICMP22404]|nr:hypothetical protein FGE05_00145 [Pseudomonas sp. ICMP22404]
MGASLLAIAVGQLASMLNVPPSSRAGSLPQGARVGMSICDMPQSTQFQRLSQKPRRFYPIPPSL